MEKNAIPKLITGVFHDKAGADSAYQQLLSKGYSTKDITIVMSSATHAKYYKGDKRDTSRPVSLIEEAGIGGSIGAIIGAVVAAGTVLAIPGLGFILAGPIVAGLAGAGAGGLTGGIVGALSGYGVPEHKAMHYEKKIKEGDIVISVRPRTAEDAEYFSANWPSA